VHPLRNIIFDLGNVLLDIDYNETTNAFKRLGVKHFEEMYSQFNADDLFEKLETGKISEGLFYQHMRTHIPGTVTDEQIDAAWSAMILTFRKTSLDYLLTLAPQYKLYLLSNTNSIHFKHVKKLFTKETGRASLDDYFTSTWYSHEIGLRKPHAACYEFVLQNAGLDPRETLFIDDLANNIEGAKGVGLVTWQLMDGERIEDIVEKFKV
jgi:HAD superfamily hydrolase (TIGR01509 family)